MNFVLLADHILSRLARILQIGTPVYGDSSAQEYQPDCSDSVCALRAGVGYTPARRCFTIRKLDSRHGKKFAL